VFVVEPLVSIIIPVYNRVNLVSRAIESALNQTYLNVEIIAGDNCSTDGTWDLLQRYARKDDRIHVFKNEENIGPVRNWIKCVNQARGIFLKFIFSDDWLSHDYLEKTVPLLKKNVAFVFTPVNLVFEGDAQLKYEWYNYFNKTRLIPSKSYLIDSLRNYKYPWSPCCTLFRTEDVNHNLLQEIPNKDNLVFSNYGAGNDKLIFLLTALKYKYVAFTPETRAYFLAHNNSLSVSNKLNKYYETANMYFINNYLDEYLSSFLYTYFWITRHKNKNDSNNRKINFMALAKILKDVILRKIFNIKDK
jgi:glycosyltransferase involved in cell wall biosynthesis